VPARPEPAPALPEPAPSSAGTSPRLCCQRARSPGTRRQLGRHQPGSARTGPKLASTRLTRLRSAGAGASSSFLSAEQTLTSTRRGCCAGHGLGCLMPAEASRSGGTRGEEACSVHQDRSNGRIARFEAPGSGSGRPLFCHEERIPGFEPQRPHLSTASRVSTASRPFGAPRTPVVNYESRFGIEPAVQTATDPGCRLRVAFRDRAGYR
jgi:hypothetical protein